MKSTFLSCLTLALAGIGQTTTAPSRAKMDDTDRRFLVAIEQGGLAELQAGQIAAQAGNPYDRRLGKRMVRTSQALTTDLIKFADKREMTVPSTPTPEDSVKVHQLEKTHDGNFDAKFRHFTVLGHRQMIQVFRDEIQNGADPMIRAWAQRKLPELRRQYRMARNIPD